MQQVSFHSPETVERACELLATHGENARVLAGGQSLVQMLKQRLVDAEHVVDISGIDGLGGIRLADDTLWIGATETYAAVSHSPTVREALPVLPETVRTIGDQQVRNRGTLVGGVAHADPEGDPPVLATATGATVRLRSRDGERTVSAPDFYRGMYETACRSDELLTAVGFPVHDDRAGAFRSYTPRQGDYAVASVAVTTGFAAGAFSDPRVVAGAVSEGPSRLPEVEAVLDGAVPDPDTLDAAAETASDSVDPMGDGEFSAAYRESMVGTLAADAVESACESAGIEV